MKILLLSLLVPLYAATHTEHFKTTHKNKTFHTKAYKEKHALGLKRTPNSKLYIEKKKLVKKLPIEGPIPKNADLSSLVSPPENQAQCGSCWAFALTKSLRSALMIAGTDPGRLAFNYLIANCGPGPAWFGCGGGDFSAGQSFLGGAGPWLESQDPYAYASGRSGGYHCKTNLPISATALEFTTVGSGGTPSFKELAAALNAKHMLTVDVAVGGSWASYDGGIYNADSTHSINHMINMVGYDCETSVDDKGNCTFNAKGEPSKGDGFLKVMNNWGTAWGENGYMRTRAHMNAVADTAMYFEVIQPPPPTPPTPPTPKTCDVVYSGFLSFLHMPWNTTKCVCTK